MPLASRYFLHAPAPSQLKGARTTNAIERLHEKFKRRIKTQTVLPSAETAAMLFWALLASPNPDEEGRWLAISHHADRRSACCARRLTR